jgi:hypothetical protein
MSVKVDKFEQSSNKNKREREENKTEGAPAEETVQ